MRAILCQRSQSDSTGKENPINMNREDEIGAIAYSLKLDQD